MIEQVETTRDGTSTAATVDSYKVDLAQRIYAVNSTQVYTTRPQALLRSVVVLKYVVDGAGNLVRSEIARSNRDRITEATALATLRKSAQDLGDPGRDDKYGHGLVQAKAAYTRIASNGCGN